MILIACCFLSILQCHRGMQEAKRQERSEITPLHCEKSRESILGIYIYMIIFLVESIVQWMNEYVGRLNRNRVICLNQDSVLNRAVYIFKLQICCRCTSN